jgi:DNA-binding transcriptional ArsR family regulator
LADNGAERVRGPTLTSQELLAVLAALSHPQRLRIIAGLAEGRVHVSELARRLGLSRPLLYMHLARLEQAGLVVGQLELSPDGKALKYFELAPFELHLTLGTILAALRADDSDADQTDADQNDKEPPQ